MDLLTKRSFRSTLKLTQPWYMYFVDSLVLFQFQAILVPFKLNVDKSQEKYWYL